MARNGAGVYSLPAGSTIANGDVSDASDLNTPLSDIEADLNTPRPIVAGGTGASSASAARTNLGVAIGTDVQAYDADLAAIAGLSSNGIVTRTGSGTAAARTITAGAGISVTNGDGASGNPTIACTVAELPPGAIQNFALRAAPAGWLKANGVPQSRTTQVNLFNAICPVIGNFTVTIASPGVFTLNGHGLINGDRVQLSTTGALPSGLNTTTEYFVVSAATNTFQLSLTLGGAAINTSGTQSGTHTVRSMPFGIGDGTTTFGIPDLRAEFQRGWDDGRGVDTGRVLGSAQAQDVQSHTHSVVTTTTTATNVGGGATVLAVGSAGQTGATGGTETRPRNVALLVCIKT